MPVILAGCLHPAVPPAPESRWYTDGQRFEQERVKAELPLWRYDAKLGIRTPEVSEQATMIWQYRDQANKVRLFGPLGAGAVEVEFDAFGVQLSDNKGVIYTGDSAEQLLYEIVGWPIPVEALSHWLFVLPQPGAPFRYQLNDADQVSLIEQLGWQISYADYRDYGMENEPLLLPRKLTALKRLGAADDQVVKVRLITQGWQW